MAIGTVDIPIDAWKNRSIYIKIKNEKARHEFPISGDKTGIDFLFMNVW